ncbi:keratin, type II cytoskeletal 6A-like [Protopterus annectens]|uniref:keratin, type II cytoskeletal 6A-like n=1 Tax=Protopterus annectens TaxID=7888 RepID=UPI001CFC0BF0|nr:keratin, type II cytoskeletal 6A-like [Protopterus annectens]
MSESSVPERHSELSSSSYTLGSKTKTTYSLGSSSGTGLNSTPAGSGGTKDIASGVGMLESFSGSASGSGGSILSDLVGARYGAGNYCDGAAAGFDSGIGLGARCSGGGAGYPPITNATMDNRLLASLDLTIDPKIEQICTQEKNEIKIVNNKFPCFNDNASDLEQSNKMSETKLALQQQPQQQGGGSDHLKSLFQAFIKIFRKKLENISSEKGTLNSELPNMENLVDFKTKYEDEINNRTAAENESVTLKKARDLEQSNKMSETKLALQQQPQQQGGGSDHLEPLFQVFIKNLLRQLESLCYEKGTLNSELSNMENLVDFKTKYEDEINNRTAAENESVTLKKDGDAAFLQKSEQEAKLNGLWD